jgi:hypothetical protein
VSAGAAFRLCLWKWRQTPNGVVLYLYLLVFVFNALLEGVYLSLMSKPRQEETDHDSKQESGNGSLRIFEPVVKKLIEEFRPRHRYPTPPAFISTGRGEKSNSSRFVEAMSK